MTDTPTPANFANPWAAVIGPVYTIAAAAEMLGITEEALTAQAAALDIIVVDTAEGDLVFPAFQFNDDNTLIAALVEPWRNLVTLGQGDPYTSVSWLRWEHPRLDGQTSIDWIRGGNPPAVVNELAAATIARWTQ